MIKKNRIMIAIHLTSIIGMLLITARTVILPAILKELDGMEYYSIIVILTSLTMSVVLPIAGKLSDMYGRKIIYFIGIVGYIVACFLCGFADSVYLFMIGIALTGVFYGCMNSVQLAIITDVFSEEERPAQVGYLTISNSVACLLGPIIGGFFVDNVGWRWVYLLMIPLGMIIFFIIAKLDNKGAIKVNQSTTIDFIGIIFFILCVVPVLLALAAAGKIYEWNSKPILYMLLFSIFMLIVFLYAESRASNPMIPFKLFHNKSYCVCVITYFICAISFSGMNYLPIFYQEVKGVTATVSGLWVLPRQMAQIVFSYYIGINLVKKKGYRKKLVVFLGLFALSLLSMSRFVITTSVFMILISEVMFGAANGVQTVITQSYGQKCLDDSIAGSGMSFICFVGAFGNSLGAAIGGCIMNQTAGISSAIKYIFLLYAILMMVGTVIAGVIKWER